MKNILIVLFFLINTLAGATTYYISPSGSDSNAGSSSSPWKTLSFACSKATAAGDIIHVAAGTYSESSQSVLRAGVSIEGDDKTTTIIKSTVGGSDYTIYMYSAAGTNGNQHISNITLNGNSLTAFAGIYCYGRNNVKIFNCNLLDFSDYGIRFDTYRQNDLNPPAVYATGNEIHDCSIINCSAYHWNPSSPWVRDAAGAEGRGAITLDCQDGFLIHHNTLDQTSRPNGMNGWLIKSVNNGGFCKNLKIYNNTITKAGEDNVSWDFAIELWSSMGGLEIYNNTITSGLDLDGGIYGVRSGNSGFGAKVYNNIIGPESGAGRAGIIFEVYVEDTYIERNYFRNENIGILQNYYISDGGAGFPSGSKNLVVRYNIMQIVGKTGTYSGPAKGIAFNSGGDPNLAAITNNYVYNNVISGTASVGSTGDGIQVPASGQANNVIISNNIVQGFSSAGIIARGFSGTSLSNLLVQNNILYNNGINTAYFSSITPTNYTNSNNLTSNPLFVSSSDFHLQAGSPAIGKGIAVSGSTNDYSGNALNSPPSIGAYESGSIPIAPVSPVYQSALVQNTTPALLEMTYDLALSTSSVPAASAFTVLVNSVGRTVSTVAIVGSKIQLTLASPIVSGNSVTVTYTKPTANPIQTAGGGQALALTNKTVTNSVSAVNPGLLSSSVENATPSLLEITYNLTLANIVPVTSAFSVMVNSAALPVSSVAISGAKVQLALSSPLKYGDIVTVAYTKPATNPLQTSSGGTAPGFSAQSIINNIINPTKNVTSVTVAMTVSPNHVHKIINVVLAYTGLTADLTASITPSIIRITDLTGTLFLEKLFDTGTTSIKIPINLASGIYKVTMLANGLEMASQKMVVYQR
jgi:uncharacterized repeat protein (TIGR02059 family)